MLRKTLGQVLSCAYIEEPAAIDQSLYIVIPLNGDVNDIKQLLGVLGSTYGAWYLRTKFAIYDLLHPWYTKAQLLMVPVPAFDSALVNKVDEALEFTNQLKQARSEDERRLLGSELSATRAAIDERVFQLLKLSKKQQKVIAEDITAVAEAGDVL
jgi:hypothetical protein